MQKFIRFEKERPFSEIQKSFIEKFGNRLSKHIWGNPEEIKKGLHRSLYSYKKLSENLKVLPYFHDKECSICLCISCDTRYIDGTPILPTLKIIGICIETPEGKEFYLDAFINSFVEGGLYSSKTVPFRDCFYIFGVLAR